MLKSAMEKCSAVIECGSNEGNCAVAKGLLEQLVLTGPNKLFVWTTGFQQYKFEDEILAHKGATICVVRPAFTYGGKYGLGAIGPLLFPGQDQKFFIGGNKNRKWPWVHMEGLFFCW